MGQLLKLCFLFTALHSAFFLNQNGKESEAKVRLTSLCCGPLC